MAEAKGTKAGQRNGDQRSSGKNVSMTRLSVGTSPIAGNMMQHRLVWSGEQLKPKLSKISPASGFKCIFGKQAAVNFLKGIFKLTAILALLAIAAIGDYIFQYHTWYERQNGLALGPPIQTLGSRARDSRLFQADGPLPPP